MVRKLSGLLALAFISMLSAASGDEFFEAQPKKKATKKDLKEMYVEQLEQAAHDCAREIKAVADFSEELLDEVRRTAVDDSYGLAELKERLATLENQRKEMRHHTDEVRSAIKKCKVKR